MNKKTISTLLFALGLLLLIPGFVLPTLVIVNGLALSSITSLMQSILFLYFVFYLIFLSPAILSFLLAIEIIKGNSKVGSGVHISDKIGLVILLVFSMLFIFLSIYLFNVTSTGGFDKIFNALVVQIPALFIYVITWKLYRRLKVRTA